MSPVALDSVKLFILMAAGGGFAVTGLWLLLRPKPASGAKIELFGMKFEASSAGLVVFLIGAAFLATPLFVPERGPTGATQASTATSGSRAGGATLGDMPAEQAVAAIPQRVRAEGREREPNDGYDKANLVAVADSWSGVINHNSDDWFVMTLAPSSASLFLKIRSVGGRDCYGVAVHTYSDDEKELGMYFILGDVYTTVSKEIPLSGEEIIFFRLASVSQFDCLYEVFTSYSPFD